MLGVNRAELNFKTSHAVSNTLTTNLIFGLTYANFKTMYDLENELKWKVSEHVRTYLSFKYSIDGFQTSLGLKVAGFKLKVPVIFMHKGDPIHENED